MAFAASRPQNRRALAPHLSGTARMDNRPGSLKSTTKPVVRLDNTPGSKNSTIKPVPPSSPASPPTRPKPKAASPSSLISSSGRRNSIPSSKDVSHQGQVSERVRVAIRLRPRNAEETIADKDFAECVELQPEMKRVQLRKNNWDYDSYQFDEVLTQTSSQKRVYEVVAKPVVESVCQGFNGTIMAYGQSGTGKTFTLGNLGEEDTADRGIMVRALEDILANVTSADDIATVSYLQLYKETVQDLLVTKKDNLAIVEDPNTGDVSVPGATQVELKDLQSFLQLLQTGEANRFAANTKLNTESSRSHAILLVNLKKVSRPNIGDNNSIKLNENKDSQQFSKGMQAPIVVWRSKLLIFDLAGSECVGKSGSKGRALEEAKSINLSLTALGKCISALAQKSRHVPTRDSKLTRMLRDSFGGTARTSLIVTIGPSPRNRGETASTILFGQKAMKVESPLKLKAEFDYRCRCRQLEKEVDKLLARNERQCQAVRDANVDFQKRLEEAQETANVTKDKLSTALKKTEIEAESLKKEDADMIVESKKTKKEHADMIVELNKTKKEHASMVVELETAKREVKDIGERYPHEFQERKLHEEKPRQESAQSSLVREQEREWLERDLGDHSHLLVQDKFLEKSHEIQELKTNLEKETNLRKKLEKELRSFKVWLGNMPNGMEINNDEEILAFKEKMV